MEEDDSILDTPQEDIIVRETQSDMTDSPRSFSRNLISRLGLSQITEAETAPSETNNIWFICVIVVRIRSQKSVILVQFLVELSSPRWQTISKFNSTV